MADTRQAEPQRIAIVFDGERWHVRRIALIEHDLEHDHKVYRCDKPISNDHPTLADVPQVAAELSRLRSLCRRAADTIEAEGDSVRHREFVAELRLAGGEENKQ